MVEGQDTGLSIPQTTIPMVHSFSTKHMCVSLKALYLLQSFSAPIAEVEQM
jgi:hypothetical protein